MKNHNFSVRFVVFIIFVLSAWVINLKALAVTQIDVDIYKLPEGLADVRTFGWWQEEKIDGRFRFLVVRKEGLRSTHVAYAQWICDCDTGRLASVPITEINDKKVRISELVSKEKDGLHYIQFKVVDVLTREEKIMQIQFMGIGTYRAASRKVYSQPSYYEKKSEK
jgi:hypothetical protein